MTPRREDQAIDELYGLPLEAFTAARNALAKQAGPRAPDVRGLAKPSLPAWAVNQVYWHDRPLYDALDAAARALREVHQHVLAGRGGDLRTAAKTHEQAVETALKAALRRLADAGHPATDASRQAVATTLRALPGAEPPGRLTAALRPAGFEMLAGLSAGGPARAGAKPATRAAGAAKQAAARAREEDARARAAARQAAAEAARAVRDAEHAMRHAEFEAARSAREAAKAARRLEEAREALRSAERAVEEAEADAETAARTKREADARAAAAARALQAARDRARTR